MEPRLMYLIGAGVLALILLVLILRFAVRPKKAPSAAGLGLNPAAPAPSGGPEKPLNSYLPPAQPTAADSAALSERPWEQVSGGGASDRGAASAASGTGAGGGAGPVSSGPAEATADGPYAGTGAGRASSVSADGKGCPKCGGSFLDGEMEGPTLMVDGVAREEFQPLLTARECSACGYLEFYTRPARD